MPISNPLVTLNILPANQEVGNVSQNVLIVGQGLAAGSYTSGDLQQNVAEADISSLFGAKSHIAQMLRAFKAINKVTAVDAIALDDAAGTEATGTYAIAGTATEAGTLVFNIGSGTNRSYSIDVASGDAHTDVSAALEAAITADTTAPFSGSDTSGTVTITAENKGTIGNDYTLELTGSVAGITVTVTGMASGATDPTLTGLFDVIGTKRYQTIVYPGAYDTTVLTTLLDARFNIDNNVLDGIAILTVTDTYASLVSTYTAINNESLAVCGNQTVSRTYKKGGAIMELNDVVSSQIAAIRALRLTPDVSIANYVISRAARDSFGGDHIRSLPYHNTPYSLIPLIPLEDEFTETEISGLLTAGVFTLGNNRAGNSVIQGSTVTTYKTDAAGNADVSFKYLNYVDTMSGIREYMYNNLKNRYAQCRLTEGDLEIGYNMANEASIRAYIAGLYTNLSGTGYVLTQAWQTALDFFKQNLTVTLDLANRKVSVSMKTPIVTQIGSIIGSIQVAFTTN